MWASLSSWQFLSCCICIAVVILTFKRAFKQFWPVLYTNSKVHGAFTLSYLVAGILAAIPKTYLPGAAFFDRLILGILASGASLAVYYAAIKRLAKVIGMPDIYSDLKDPDDNPKESPVQEAPKPVDNPPKP